MPHNKTKNTKSKLQITEDIAGHKIVILPDIIFKNKQHIDWTAVEKYLQRYVGEIVTIADTNDIVFIGADLYNVYSACLLINCTKFNNMYLYDLIDIKKEASTPLKTNE
ncbi:MAG: hypothetical protein Q4D94_10545 [Bacillota bacterium]|nr:hypothetical protein [Bacillota bacterium]